MIEDYIKSKARNKIIISSAMDSNLSYLNVGQELSKVIKLIVNKRHFALKAKKLLDTLFSDAIVKVEPYGSILAMTNLGILFEEELKLNFLHLIEKYSKDNTLFLHWEGEIEGNDLYFLSKKNGLKIDIKNLSHVKHEI